MLLPVNLALLTLNKASWLYLSLSQNLVLFGMLAFSRFLQGKYKENSKWNNIFLLDEYFTSEIVFRGNLVDTFGVSIA